MCVVGSFRRQYVLLYVLGGNVCYFVFQVAMFVVRSFRWQCVLVGRLGGKLSYLVF